MAVGCSAVLGLGDYSFGGNPGPGDATDAAAETESDAGSDVVNCNVDLSAVCYPCPAETNAEFLNSCTDGTCVAFDKSRLNGLILGDGGLPPLPDGG
jgi:hypothetical protein